MTGTPQLRELYPHQQRAMDGLFASLASGKRRPMLQLPTGAGKTVIAAHIVAGALRKRKRIAFCVPTLGLVDQTFDRFIENGIDPASIGIIQADHPFRCPHAPVQIATAQTLSRRDLPEVDCVVIDEGHVQHAIYAKWMNLPGWESKPFIGLSATPWSKGLGKLYDDLIRPTSIRELIDGGYLSNFRVFAPSHPDLEGVRTVAGDYHEGDLAERMGKDQLVADIVETWLARGNGAPTLCFAVNRAHARMIHDQFAKAGVASAYVDADTPREERSSVGRMLARGEIKIAVNIGTLTTGIDWDVRCLILARPTKSEMLFTQIIGRALRTADGKDAATILDHSDTTLRLGLVTDIAFDALDSGKKAKAGQSAKRERTVPLPRECHACACIIPAAMTTCFACGAEIKRPHGVTTAAGELEELGRTKKLPGDPSAIEQVRRMPRTTVFAQIKWVQMETGRADGWAAHTYRDVFGNWPNGLQNVVPVEPVWQVRSMIRAKQIRFAQSKLGAEHAAR